MDIMARVREAYRMQEYRLVDLGRIGPVRVSACGFELVLVYGEAGTSYMLRAGYSPADCAVRVRFQWPPRWAVNARKKERAA